MNWAEMAELLPEAGSMDSDLVYPLGENSAYAAAFLCPCKCGKLVHIVLDSPAWSKGVESPSWVTNAIVAGQPVTLSPSLQGLRGCKSHFFIEDGKVRFV